MIFPVPLVTLKNQICVIVCILIWASVIISSPLASAQSQELRVGQSVKQDFSAESSDSYTIALQKGAFVKLAVEEEDAGVLVSIFRPDGTLVDSFDALIRKIGDPHVRFLADTTGDFRIQITADRLSWLRPGTYELHLSEIIDNRTFQSRQEEKGSLNREVATWIEEHALNLPLSGAPTGLNDLEPLKQTLANVRVVGLGEATHGTSEFFMAKRRLVEFLVTELNFTVFAIEASFSACEEINDYVAGKDIDLKTALANLGYWMWNTEEVASLIEWMREYNTRASNDKRIRFVGIDIQSNAKALEVVGDYVRRHVPELSVYADSTIALFRVVERKVPDEQLLEVRDSLDALIAEFMLRESQLIIGGTELAFEKALQHLLVLRQWTDFQEDFPLQAYKRDFHMAQNVLTILRQREPGTRIALWAHNVHLSKGEKVLDGSPAVGYVLKDALGDAYYAVAFEFSQGAFRAFEQTASGDFIGLHELTLMQESVGSLGSALKQTGLDPFIVDLRSVRATETTSEWVNKLFDMHVIGGRFGADWTLFKWMKPVKLFEEFDGLVYVSQSSPSKPSQ